MSGVLGLLEVPSSGFQGRACVKVLVVGNARSGKTSVVRALCGLEAPTAHCGTPGVEVTHHVDSSGAVMCQYYDVGGAVAGRCRQGDSMYQWADVARGHPDEGPAKFDTALVVLSAAEKKPTQFASEAAQDLAQRYRIPADRIIVVLTSTGAAAPTVNLNSLSEATNCPAISIDPNSPGPALQALTTLIVAGKGGAQDARHADQFRRWQR